MASTATSTSIRKPTSNSSARPPAILPFPAGVVRAYPRTLVVLATASTSNWFSDRFFWLFRFSVRNANNGRVGRAQRAPPILLRSAFGGARFTRPSLLLHLKPEEPFFYLLAFGDLICLLVAASANGPCSSRWSLSSTARSSNVPNHCGADIRSLAESTRQGGQFAVVAAWRERHDS